MRSRVDPLLPVKPSASAARATRPAASSPSSLRVAAPIFRASSQNTTRTPLPSALKRSNSIFNSIAITSSSCRLRPSPYAPKAPESIAGGPVSTSVAECRDRQPANILERWANHPNRRRSSVGSHHLGRHRPCVSRGALPTDMVQFAGNDPGAVGKGSLVQALNHSSLNFNSFALRRPFCGRIKLICIGWGLGASQAPLGFRTRCDSAAGGDVLRDGTGRLDQFCGAGYGCRPGLRRCLGAPPIGAAGGCLEPDFRSFFRRL